MVVVEVVVENKSEVVRGCNRHRSSESGSRPSSSGSGSGSSSSPKSKENDKVAPMNNTKDNKNAQRSGEKAPGRLP